MTATYSYDAENYVLGCILQDNTLMDECNLDHNNFRDNRNVFIYQAMKELNEKRLPIDAVGLFETLGAKMDYVGMDYIGHLKNHVPSLVPFQHYCKVVVDHWKEHKAKNLLKESLEKKDLNSDSIQSLIQDLNNIDDHGQDDEFDLIEHLTDLYELPFIETPPGLSGIKTGFKELDSLTDGWQDEDLIIIGARPSVGKTAFSLNVALHAGRKNTIVTYFSIEMSAKAMLKRLIAMIAGIDGVNVRNPYHQLNEKEKESWINAISVIEANRPYIFDKSKQTVNYMRSKIRKIKKAHPDKKHLVVIDYLTKVDSPNVHASNHTKYTEISADLKAMAKDFEIPVICLAQLSRGVEQRNNKRPMMSDLRESGSIEQDADVIGFLYREEYQNGEESDIQKVELNITKQRNGPLGLVEMSFYKKTGRFKDYIGG